MNGLCDARSLLQSQRVEIHRDHHMHTKLASPPHGEKIFLSNSHNWKA
jgi:hypothetical protein